LEASRTLGILGALDPVHAWKEEKNNEEVDKPLRSPSQSNTESQYAAVAVAVVHRVLQDSSIPIHIGIQPLTFILQSLGREAGEHMKTLIPLILELFDKYDGPANTENIKLLFR